MILDFAILVHASEENLRRLLRSLRVRSPRRRPGESAAAYRRKLALAVELAVERDREGEPGEGSSND